MDFALPELSTRQIHLGLEYGFLGLVLLGDLVWRGFRPTWGERLLKSAIASVSFAAVNLAVGGTVMVGVDAIQQVIVTLSLPHLPSWVWAPFPSWALLLFSIIAVDFCDYWNHRALHSRLLWPIHAIHHSDPDVTAMTTMRVHFLEPAFMILTYAVLLGFLGMPPVAAGLGSSFLIMLNYYVHINVDWHHGPARYLLASPRWHRWHHADVPAAHNKNFANVFPFYDVLFGTFYEPGPCNVKLGAEGVPENNVPLLLIWPFLEWGRMIRAAVTGAGSVRSEAPRQTESSQ